VEDAAPSVVGSEPSVLKYQPPVPTRYEAVSKPNDFKRRSEFGSSQDWSEYDLRKPNPYANQPPPVPYGIGGIAPGGSAYVYGEQGRSSQDDTSQMTDEEYMNLETMQHGGVGGFASMLPPPPPAPPAPPSSTEPRHHHERDSEYSMHFGAPHGDAQGQYQQQQHLQPLSAEHIEPDSPISGTAPHFVTSSIGPPRPAPPPPGHAPDIIAPRAQYAPLQFPMPPPIPPPATTPDIQPQQPQFVHVDPDEHEGYYVEGEEYQFHPRQYDEDEEQWYADGGEGQDLDVGQYYAPQQQHFDHTKQ